jgi:HEAT repeat protein
MLRGRPTRSWIEAEIVPTLLKISQLTNNRDILDSALIALGRSAETQHRELVRQTAARLLSHHEVSVQAAAALSLGILLDDESVGLLTELLTDTSVGRQAIGGGRVPWMVRSFACLGLGLIGSDGAIDALLAAVTEFPDSERDIKACAFAALGLLDDRSDRKDEVVDMMLAMLVDEQLDGVLRSYVPTTLGKLGEPRAVPALLAVLGDREAPDAVRQSAAIGLARLAVLSDRSVVAELERQVKSGHDQLTRRFALVTLARLGADDIDGAATAGAHDRLINLLEKELTGRGAQRSHRSWAALGAALYARAHPLSAARLLVPLRRGFEDENDPSFKGAFAIALALCDDQSSAAAIHESLLDSHQDDYRGYASEALGLLRHIEAAPLLRQLCVDEGLPESFRLKAATGLGLMGDTDAVPLLVDSMLAVRSLGGLSALAQALGLIGNQSVGPPLVGMAVDDSRHELSRAFATVALGLLGERGELPFNAALRADNNYLHQTPAFAEVLRIL